MTARLTLVSGTCARSQDDERRNCVRIDGKRTAMEPAAGRMPTVSLGESAALDLERAEGFLLDLARETVADGPRAAYLLGLAEGHLANCIQRLREVTR